MDIQDLLSEVALIDVSFLEYSGVRRLSAAETTGGASQLGELPLQIDVQASGWDALIEVRFRARLEMSGAELKVAVGVQYSRPDGGGEIPVGLQEQFIQSVAVMAAFPYLREGLQSLALRLGADVPLLGILRQGDFVLKPRGEEGVEPLPGTDLVDE